MTTKLRYGLAAPTLHLNGTSAASLIEGYMDAVHALHEAGRKLAATAPNGRDYYVQGPRALDLALGQHDQRMQALKAIISDLEALAMHIDDNRHDK